MAAILIVDEHMLNGVHAAHPDLLRDMDGCEFVNPLRGVVGANGAGRIS